MGIGIGCMLYHALRSDGRTMQKHDPCTNRTRIVPCNTLYPHIDSVVTSTLTIDARNSSRASHPICTKNSLGTNTKSSTRERDVVTHPSTYSIFSRVTVQEQGTVYFLFFFT